MKFSRFMNLLLSSVVWVSVQSSKSAVLAFTPPIEMQKEQYNAPRWQRQNEFSLSFEQSVIGDVPLAACQRTMEEDPCFWKPSWPKSRWLRRLHLDDLKVGQRLQGTVVQELLDGKTGPKLFLDIGVGKTDARGRWSIVTGMVRMDRAKTSVVNKRATRIRRKDFLDVWVSRINKESGRLEVCLKEEDLKKYTKREKKLRISSLAKGSEVRGTVVRVLPYGVLVDVGANRNGLLHILKVRRLYGKYIDGEKGLIDAGLECGANIRLCVESVEKRRLALDFTDDVKAETSEDMENNTITPDKSIESVSSSGMSAEELAEWAAFASSSDTQAEATGSSSQSSIESESINQSENLDDDDDDDEDEEYDGYDEERDIEDSLGLGFY